MRPDIVRLYAWEGEGGDVERRAFLDSLSPQELDRLTVWTGHRQKSGLDSKPSPPTIHLVVAYDEIGPAAGGKVASWSWAGECVLSGEAPSPDANGLLCNFADIGSSDEEEFNAWYDTEHLPILRRHPSLLGASRFRATAQGQRYLALYLLADAVAAQSPEWSALLDTPWSRRITPRRLNPARMLFRRG
jgi:hypothetical protein